MQFATKAADLTLIAASIADDTRPASGMGTSITPAQNAWGSWATVISSGSVTAGVYWLVICANTWGINTAARDALIDIGIDPAGGTSFTSIVGSGLVAGQASGYVGNTGPGVFFELPIFIPSGSTIGARASVNSATLTAGRVFISAYGRPSPSHAFKPGRRIQSLGVTAASSAGTAVTSGTGSDGSWTSIGTLSAAAFAFEFGLGVQDSALNSNTIDVDIAVGDASNKRIVIRNHPIMTSNAETISKAAALAYADAASGDIVYARLQTGPNAAPAATSVAVYAIGS